MTINLHHIPSLDYMRQRARARLPRAVFDFIDGGADDEQTLAANRSAFERYRFAPRVLRDVSQITIEKAPVSAKERASSMPVIISPTGLAGLAWPDGEKHLAAAAESHNIPYTLAALGSCSIEDTAAVGHSHKWFQLYVLKDRDITADLIQRALQCDYDTLVVTVDVPVIGKRERDAVNGFTMPLSLTPATCLDLLMHPAWSLATLRAGVPLMQSLLRYNEMNARSVAAHAAWINRLFDPAADWQSIAEIRAAWPRRLLIKGILHADDARRARDAGADGIVISNHGGRQLDSALPSVVALDTIASELQGEMPLILDSGVRRGTDVVKALCLGASAVMMGRPTLFGLAVAGEAGASRVLTILAEEISRCLALLGVDDINSLQRDMLTLSS